MTLDAPTYFGHLRAYVNDRYVMHDGDGGEVVLREKYFPPPPATRAETRKLRLLLPGPGLAFKLDHDQFQLRKRKSKRLYSTFSTTMRNLGRNAAIS